MPKKTTSKHQQKQSISQVLHHFYLQPFCRFTNNFSYKSLFTVLLILFASNIFLYKITNSLKTVSAGWWNDTWHYRNSIPVTNNTTQETNVYISITVDTSDTSKFQDDAGDLRFTQASGQLLDYYINSGVGTTSTSIHVNFDTLITGSQTIYYYYGNPSASNGFLSSDFSTQASSYTIGSLGSEEKSASPIAHYRFDESQGTVIYDESSNNYDGTLGTGSSAPSWADGKLSKALDFDGTGDYLTIGSTIPNLQSISFWINPDSTTESILDLDGTHNVSISSGIISATGFSSPSVYVNGIGSSTISADQWSHIAITTATPFDANDIDIGRISTSYFDGTLDEIRIFNYTLTPDQIKNEYNRSSAVVLGIGQNDSDPGSANLQAWWKMDDDTGGISYEQVTDAYFADELLWYSTLENANSSTSPDTGTGYIDAIDSVDFVTAKYGNGMRFDADSESFRIPVTSADSGNFDASEGAFDFWFQPTWDHDDGLYHYFFHNYYDEENAFTLQKMDSLNGNILRFRIEASNIRYTYQISSSDYSWNANDWIHLRAEWDDTASTADQQKIFINGVEPTHTDSAGDYNSASLTLNSTFTIGNQGQSGTYECNGIIDEFYIYGGSSTTPTDIAEDGDTADPDEYLYDQDNDYTLDFVVDDASNRGEYIFIGSDSVFFNINIDLQTLGSGTTPDLNWQYWDGDEWANLESVDGFTDESDNLTQNGNISWSATPTGWSTYSVNGSSDLYYVRAHLESGSYTTSPVENLIRLSQQTSYATTIKDISGNNHTGTFGTGSSAPTWTLGKIGKALDFDGTSDYLTIGSTIPNLQSISFWINPDSTTESILDLDGTHNVSISSGIISATGFSSPSVYVNGIGSSTISADQWSHIAITTATPFDADDINIGRISTNYFDGTLDNVKIYDKALSTAEISWEYNQGAPVAHYRFDESQGTTVYDESSNNYDGALGTGSSAPLWVNGKIGKALDFDGTGDYLTIGSTIPNLQSISFWINPDSTTESILDLDGTHNVSISSGIISATGFSSPSVYVNGIGSSTISADQWSHIAITTATPFDADDINIGRISTNYFDGTLDEIRIFNYALTPDQIKNEYNRSSAVVLGIGQNDSDPGSANLQAWWKMDNNIDTGYKQITDAYFANELIWYSDLNGTTADVGTDTTQDSNDFVSANYGNGARFDAVGESLYFTPASDDFNESAGAIEFWFQPAYDHTTATRYDLWRAYTDASNYIFFSHTTTGSLLLRIADAGTAIDYTITSANYSWSVSDWVHLRIEWDASEAVSTQQRIFVNGVEPTHTDDPESDDYNGMADLANFFIGNNSPTASYYANGIIDEFYIYGGSSTTPTDIAEDGDTADPDEYLYDQDNDYTLDFVADDANNRGEYIFIGSDSVFFNINIDLQTLGSGTTPNLNWQYWDGDEWANLESVDGFTDGSNDLTQNGNISWSATPTGWSTYSVNGSSDLYYVRAHLESGSYTTSPVENLIRLSQQTSYATTIKDISGNNHTGTFGTGSSAPTWTLGKIGKALDFDGTGDYLTIGSTIPNLQSISFWINPDSTTESILDLDGTHNVSISSGIISATGFSSPSVYVNGIGSSTISADQWSHIAITTATPFDANDIDIGRISTNYFDGTIDNVKIYDKALSTAEISWEYNQGAPIAHWALNEGLGTTAYDESDHDYDSTLGTGNSSPSWVDGKTSKALDFDGTNDYVSLPNSFNLNQGSVTAWVKTTDTTGVIFAEGNSASSDPYFMLTIYPSAAGIYRSSYQGLAYGNTNITDNKWHFITWTQTGSANGLKIYIDGQEETLTWTEGSNNGGWFDDCAGNTFAIGVLDRSSDWGYLDGIIDEVKVYNYVLTTNQIKTNYNNEAIKFN